MLKVACSSLFSLSVMALCSSAFAGFNCKSADGASEVWLVCHSQKPAVHVTSAAISQHYKKSGLNIDKLENAQGFEVEVNRSCTSMTAVLSAPGSGTDAVWGFEFRAKEAALNTDAQVNVVDMEGTSFHFHLKCEGTPELDR